MMTELEVIAHAKVYMEKLALGINPLDDTPIPDGEAIHHVRLSRCFTFVSKVLGQVIENGGVTPRKSGRPEKLPFSLTAEERSAFPFSRTPIPVSEIASRLNALSSRENMRGMTGARIAAWLADAGLLELVPQPDGKEAKRPTPQGTALGILSVQRTSLQGEPYQVLVYTPQAQHFVVDNLEAVTAFDQARLERQGQPWTAEEDARLQELYGQEMPVGRIARELRRRVSAVRARLRKLGLAGD